MSPQTHFCNIKSWCTRVKPESKNNLSGSYYVITQFINCVIIINIIYQAFSTNMLDLHYIMKAFKMCLIFPWLCWKFSDVQKRMASIIRSLLQKISVAFLTKIKVKRPSTLIGCMKSCNSYIVHKWMNENSSSAFKMCAIPIDGCSCGKNEYFSW